MKYRLVAGRAFFARRFTGAYLSHSLYENDLGKWLYHTEVTSVWGDNTNDLLSFFCIIGIQMDNRNSSSKMYRIVQNVQNSTNRMYIDTEVTFTISLSFLIFFFERWTFKRGNFLNSFFSPSKNCPIFLKRSKTDDDHQPSSGSAWTQVHLISESYTFWWVLIICNA